MGNLDKYGSDLLQVGGATSVHPGIGVSLLISGICFPQVGAGGSNGRGGVWGSRSSNDHTSVYVFPWPQFVWFNPSLS